MKRWSTEGRESILYDTVMVNTCHCTFVRAHRIYNSKTNPKVNYGLRGTIMYQCRFINCKMYLSGRDVDNGGHLLHVWGQGVYGTLCTFHSFFL